MGVKRGREPGSDGAEEEIEYERLRNARLAENQKRMEELGLVGLSKSLSESVRSPSLSSRSPRTPSSIPRVSTPAGPARRSSRLSGSPVVSYAENVKKESERKEKTAGRRASQAGTGGFQPEIYTEEHEKLLGSAKSEWQLFVDGYDANGTRIYDPVRGKTCHQCRQKTMGRRTSCSCCQSLHGQFCGDCLYMRYGENVVEVNENADWECPVCRQICNCSFCRLKRGWTPTGSLYRKIKSLGYKSVAHYLVLTRRGDTEVQAQDEELPKGGDLKLEEMPTTDDVKPSVVKEEEAPVQPPETCDKTTAEVTPKLENLVESGVSTSLVTPKTETRTRVPEAKVTPLSATWRSRRALSNRSKEGLPPHIAREKQSSLRGGDTPLQVCNPGEDSSEPGYGAANGDVVNEEPKKRRGRPRKNSPAGKGSAYFSAPQILIDAKPELEQPVLLLDSDTEEVVEAVNTVSIAQRLHRRRVC